MPVITTTIYVTVSPVAQAVTITTLVVIYRCSPACIHRCEYGGRHKYSASSQPTRFSKKLLNTFTNVVVEMRRQRLYFILRFSYRYKRFLFSSCNLPQFLFVGREDADRGGADFRYLLASFSCLFHSNIEVARTHH